MVRSSLFLVLPYELSNKPERHRGLGRAQASAARSPTWPLVSIPKLISLQQREVLSIPDSIDVITPSITSDPSQPSFYILNYLGIDPSGLGWVFYCLVLLATVGPTRQLESLQGDPTCIISLRHGFSRNINVGFTMPTPAWKCPV